MSVSASNKATEKEAEALAQDLTVELRRKATDAGWPSSVIIVLSVIFKDGLLVIDYPESMVNKIEDLEYGSESTPPNSVLRAFQNRIGETLKEFYEKQADKIMSEMELF